MAMILMIATRISTNIDSSGAARPGGTTCKGVIAYQPRPFRACHPIRPTSTRPCKAREPSPLSPAGRGVGGEGETLLALTGSAPLPPPPPPPRGGGESGAPPLPPRTARHPRALAHYCTPPAR